MLLGYEVVDFATEQCTQYIVSHSSVVLRQNTLLCRWLWSKLFCAAHGSFGVRLY